MSDSTLLEKLSKQSSWYGERARHNRRRYILLKSAQMFFAAVIPVVAVGVASDAQRWATAIFGALIGFVEALIQLGQYQQNWLLYRATREALKREEFLYAANAGPYANIQIPVTLYFERCDSIISGEHSKWLLSQEQPKKEGT